MTVQKDEKINLTKESAEEPMRPDETLTDYAARKFPEFNRKKLPKDWCKVIFKK